MQQTYSTNIVRNVGITLLALNTQSANAVPLHGDSSGWVHILSEDLSQSKAAAFQARFDAEIRASRFALENAKNLEDGWEGSGTLAPSIGAIIVADSFLQSLDSRVRPPEISIGTDGEVNIFWRSAQLFVDLSFYNADGGKLYARVGKKKLRNLPPIKSMDQVPKEVFEAVAWR